MLDPLFFCLDGSIDELVAVHRVTDDPVVRRTDNESLNTISKDSFLIHFHKTNVPIPAVMEVGHLFFHGTFFMIAEDNIIVA